MTGGLEKGQQFRRMRGVDISYDHHRPHRCDSDQEYSRKRDEVFDRMEVTGGTCRHIGPAPQRGLARRWGFGANGRRSAQRTPRPENNEKVDDRGEKEGGDDELAVVNVAVVAAPAEEGDTGVEQEEANEGVEGEKGEEERIKEGEGAAIEATLGAADLGKGEETEERCTLYGQPYYNQERLSDQKEQFFGPVHDSTDFYVLSIENRQPQCREESESNPTCADELGTGEEGGFDGCGRLRGHIGPTPRRGWAYTVKRGASFGAGEEDQGPDGEGDAEHVGGEGEEGEDAGGDGAWE